MKSSLLRPLCLPLFSLAGESPVDAVRFGYSVNASGLNNRDDLQKAIDIGWRHFGEQAGCVKYRRGFLQGKPDNPCFRQRSLPQESGRGGCISHLIIKKGVSKRLYGELIVIKGLQLTSEWHGCVQVCRTLRTAWPACVLPCEVPAYRGVSLSRSWQDAIWHPYLFIRGCCRDQGYEGRCALRTGEAVHREKRRVADL